MQPDPLTPSWFSWRRASLHALFPVGLVLVGGFLLVLTDQIPKVARFYEGQARLCLFLFLLGFSFSYLLQKGERLLAWSLCFGVVLAFLLTGLSLLLALSL